LKIGVSGANGFIGRNLVLKMKEIENVEVIVFGRNRSIPRTEPHPNLVPWDIFDESFDYELVPKVDKFVHLAWSGIPHYDQIEHLTQISGHTKLINEVMSKGCETLLTTGTCFEYDNPSGSVSENAPIVGSSSYSEAKIQFSKIVQSIADKHMSQNIWARLFYVYGTGQPSHTLFGSFQRAVHTDEREFHLSNANTKLDYLEVSELTDKLVDLLFAKSASGTFNVGSGTPVSLGTLVESWKLDLNSKISILDSEIQPTKSFWADVSKLNSIVK
jgi:nucleoside-diphosphate-sugar epimerase